MGSRGVWRVSEGAPAGVPCFACSPSPCWLGRRRAGGSVARLWLVERAAVRLRAASMAIDVRARSGLRRVRLVHVEPGRTPRVIAGWRARCAASQRPGRPARSKVVFDAGTVTPYRIPTWSRGRWWHWYLVPEAQGKMCWFEGRCLTWLHSAPCRPVDGAVACACGTGRVRRQRVAVV